MAVIDEMINKLNEGREDSASFETFIRASDYIDECTKVSAEELIARVGGEDRLVRIMNFVQSIFTARMVYNGDAAGILLSALSASNKLDTYTHSIVIAFFGILLDEEVIR